MKDGGTVAGVNLSPDDLVFSFPRPLCMGGYWSLYFAQSANETLMASVKQLSASRLFNSDPLVIQAAVNGAQVGHFGNYHYVYVDNLGVMSADRRHVEESIDAIQQAFDERGLNLNPGKWPLTRPTRSDADST